MFKVGWFSSYWMKYQGGPKNHAVYAKDHRPVCGVGAKGSFNEVSDHLDVSQVHCKVCLLRINSKRFKETYDGKA